MLTDQNFLDRKFKLYYDNKEANPKYKVYLALGTRTAGESIRTTLLGITYYPEHNMMNISSRYTQPLFYIEMFASSYADDEDNIDDLIRMSKFSITELEDLELSTLTKFGEGSDRYKKQN